MIKIALVDDNKNFCLILKSKIQFIKINEEYSIDIFHSGVDFLKVKQNYHIVFLDIDMPGIDGIEVSKQCETETLSIIFLTSLLGRMGDAFRKNVHSFIDKSDIDFKLSGVLLKEVNDILVFKDIFLKTSDGLFGFRFAEIQYFELIGRKVYCFTQKVSYEIVNMTLIEIMSELDNWFLQINRYQIINIRHIEIFKSNIFTLNSEKNKKFAISRDRKNQVLRKYLDRILHED